MLTVEEYERLADAMRQQHITRLDAGRLMTDAVLEHVATLEHVTALGLGGWRQLTDEGLRHPARMPQLQHLELDECPGGRLTDRGLEVLRHLPNLRTFELTWQRGVTDAGVSTCDFAITSNVSI